MNDPERTLAERITYLEGRAEARAQLDNWRRVLADTERRLERLCDRVERVCEKIERRIDAR